MGIVTLANNYISHALICEDYCFFLDPFTDAEKIKDQITYNLHSSNKFESKQNSTLNNATSIPSQFLNQPYIILSKFKSWPEIVPLNFCHDCLKLIITI